MTPQTKQHHTPGRYLQALVVSKGDPLGAAAFVSAQPWTDREDIITALKTAVGAVDTTDAGAGIVGPVADAFLAAMRPYSIPLRLEALRRVPLHTRIYVSASGITTTVTPAEGAALPVLAGDWNETTLAPGLYGGIVVQTMELARSMTPNASAAITDDLAAATAENENRAFINPEVSGSVLNGAPAFYASGSTAAAIGTDLKRLFSLVPGSWRPGTALVMAKETALYIHFSDASLFPNVGPMGGSIAGVPVLISTAAELAGSPSERIIGLVSSADIFWADRGRVVLSTSQQAALQMDNAPTQNAATGTASSAVSLFQTNSIGTRAVRESAWYARSGAGAYVRVSY